MNEVQGGFGAALPIPGNRFFNIRDCALVISTGLALIHHGQKLAMQLFPGDGHSFALFQVFDSACYFLVSGLLDRFIATLKAIEQGVGQRCSLVRGEGKRPF